MSVIFRRNSEKRRKSKKQRVFSVVLNGEFAITKIPAERLFSLPICVKMIWVMKMDKEKELPQRKHPRLD
ncbi:MAG: hypothetical protein ACI3XQ_12285, partial [Eubacteriales bacterium]